MNNIYNILREEVLHILFSTLWRKEIKSYKKDVITVYRSFLQKVGKIFKIVIKNTGGFDNVKLYGCT